MAIDSSLSSMKTPGSSPRCGRIAAAMASIVEVAVAAPGCMMSCLARESRGDGSGEVDIAWNRNALLKIGKPPAADDADRRSQVWWRAEPSNRADVRRQVDGGGIGIERGQGSVEVEEQKLVAPGATLAKLGGGADRAHSTDRPHSVRRCSRAYSLLDDPECRGRARLCTGTRCRLHDRHGVAADGDRCGSRVGGSVRRDR